MRHCVKEVDSLFHPKVRWGFEKDGKVIRPEKVAVYVLATE